MAISNLTGQVALVTGAAKRLGAAMARTLHEDGADVVVHYRSSRTAAEQLVAQLNACRPASAYAVACDVLDTANLPQLIDTVVERYGRLDILINNASSFFPTPMGEITAAQWDDLIGTNLRAPLFLAQAATAHLKRSRGLILNMVDIHGQRPLPAHPVYSAAKAGLIMLTRSLARELGPEVRVNGIAPGPVLWPEHGLAPELQEEIIRKTLLQRHGEPDDIARAVLFFAKNAPFVTGQILAIDGGRSIGW